MSDTPPPCWIDEKIKKLNSKDPKGSDSTSKTKLYGIWRKYKPSTKKKIVELCGKKTKRAINKKKL